jgi:hypothetical protein
MCMVAKPRLGQVVDMAAPLGAWFATERAGLLQLVSAQSPRPVGKS